MAKVSVYTLVHNAGTFLDTCITSVLSQTYTDFEYIIVDNASTDGSLKKLQQYAEQDSRIRLFAFDENKFGRYLRIMNQYAIGEYYAVLDHDDWWEPDYLERLLKFAEENDLDIACTGTRMHSLKDGTEYVRALEQTLTVSKEQYAELYPIYHVFFRTSWNKLVRREIVRQVDPEKIPVLPYGRDTIICFQMLRYSNRIGIDASVLHHYNIHTNSQSHQYHPARFDSDVYLYKDAMDFLSVYGEISDANIQFMCLVYLAAIDDTRRVIKHSQLSIEEQMKEYRRIVEYPITEAIFHGYNQKVFNVRDSFLEEILRIGMELTEENKDFQAAMKIILPNCGQAVKVKNLKLFMDEPELLQSLIWDDKKIFVKAVLELVNNEKYSEKYDFVDILRGIIVADSPLYQVADVEFFKQYADICVLIIDQKYENALDKMTGLLCEENSFYGKEIFIQLYLTLAALINMVSCFLFGKVQLANLYLREERWEECKNVIAQLKTMGMGEHEDVIKLQQLIGEK